MKVFRNYTQAELELQYDSGSRNPELNATRDARQKRVEAEAAEIRRTATTARGGAPDGAWAGPANA